MLGDRRVLDPVQSDPTVPTLGSLLAATLDLAGLFVKFPSSHLFLQSASLNQLAEPAYRILNRLSIADLQLNHASDSSDLSALASVSETACASKFLNSLFLATHRILLCATTLYRSLRIAVSTFRGQNLSLTMPTRPGYFAGSRQKKPG